MKKLSVLLLTVLIFSIAGADVSNTFEQAGELYKAEKYEEAASLYEQLIQKGYETPDIYYNLGNSYFRLGELAEAILYYERAKRLAPTDEDIDFNLNVAKANTIDKIEPTPKFFLTAWYESVVSILPSDTWAILFVASVWAVFFMVALFALSKVSINKRIFFGLAGIFLIVAILTAAFSASANSIEEARDEAIVFDEAVYVKNSPNSKSSDALIIHEGTKLQTLEEIEDPSEDILWVQIKLADGKKGWIPSSTIRKI